MTTELTRTLRYDEVEIGQQLPELEVELTPTLIISTAIASRDYQDVHHDRDLAQQRGSKDIFMNILSSNGFVGRFVTDWRQHRLSFESAQPGNNWLLVIQGAEHYLGNLICRTERDAEPQPDALRMVNAASLNFLKAQLQDDAAAMALLDADYLSQPTGGYARIEHR